MTPGQHFYSIRPDGTRRRGVFLGMQMLGVLAPTPRVHFEDADAPQLLCFNMLRSRGVKIKPIVRIGETK